MKGSTEGNKGNTRRLATSVVADFGWRFLHSFSRYLAGICIYIYMCVYIYIYICMYVYIYIYINREFLPWVRNMLSAISVYWHQKTSSILATSSVSWSDPWVVSPQFIQDLCQLGEQSHPTIWWLWLYQVTGTYNFDGRILANQLIWRIFYFSLDIDISQVVEDFGTIKSSPIP